MLRGCVLLVVSSCVCTAKVWGQRQFYAGVVGGIATLSGAAESSPGSAGASVSLYSTENGPALNLFAGVHLSNYVSVQANYIGNRNHLALTSAFVGSPGNFFQQPRSSAQNAFVADVLVYVRERRSRVRPYLSGGLAAIHLSSRIRGQTILQGTPKVPAAEFTSTFPGLRVAVGADLRLGRGWFFRYSFSETLSSNPISHQLVPPPASLLKNFQNLFGIVRTF